MRITCPKCGHTAEVDESVIHTGSASVRCNACGERFSLPKDSGTQVGNLRRKRLRCPICMTEQNQGDRCQECGLIFESFISEHASTAVGDRIYSMSSAPAPLKASYRDNKSLHNSFPQHIAVHKLLKNKYYYSLLLIYFVILLMIYGFDLWNIEILIKLISPIESMIPTISLTASITPNPGASKLILAFSWVMIIPFYISKILFFGGMKLIG